MLIDFDDYTTCVGGYDLLDEALAEYRNNRFLRWVRAWSTALAKAGWVIVDRAPRKARRRLLRTSAVAPFDLYHSGTGQLICFLDQVFCPGSASAIKETQRRYPKTKVLIRAEPQSGEGYIDTDGNLRDLFSFEEMAWCLTLGAVIDYGGKPFEVAPAENLTLGRLLPSADTDVLSLFEYLGGRYEK